MSINLGVDIYTSYGVSSDGQKRLTHVTTHRNLECVLGERNQTPRS